MAKNNNFYITIIEKNILLIHYSYEMIALQTGIHIFLIDVTD